MTTHTPQLVLADRLFDGRSPVIADAGVLFAGDTILAAGPRAAVSAKAPPDTIRINLPGCTLLPGLIDTHSHLIMPGDGTGIIEQTQLPDDLLLLTGAANARLALASGVTTLVDLGAKDQLTFRLRDAITRGIIPGPDLVLAGRALTITGGHAWPWGGEVDGADAARRAVRQLCREGADLIKVMATGGGTPGTNGRRPSFTLAELTAIVEEAHARDRRVWAHCTATAGIERALEAGVDVIAHCQFIAAGGADAFDPTLADRIATAGVIVNPTLQVNRVLQSARVPAARRPGLAAWVARYPLFEATLRELHFRGVALICGSDCGWGYLTFDETYLELDALVAAGLSPVEALVSATSAAAAALGRGDQIGMLAAGYRADIIAVPGDPTAAIGDLRAVRAGWRQGRPFATNAAEPPASVR